MNCPNCSTPVRKTARPLPSDALPDRVKAELAAAEEQARRTPEKGMVGLAVREGQIFEVWGEVAGHGVDAERLSYRTPGGHWVRAYTEGPHPEDKVEPFTWRPIGEVHSALARHLPAEPTDKVDENPLVVDNDKRHELTQALTASAGEAAATAALAASMVEHRR